MDDAINDFISIASHELREVVRKYMICLEPGDFEQPEMRAKLAMIAGMEPSELECRFAPIIELREEEAGHLSSAP